MTIIGCSTISKLILADIAFEIAKIGDVMVSDKKQKANVVASGSAFRPEQVSNVKSQPGGCRANAYKR